jgi:1-acyl-sn-glycerol-3-phosphate acyltransferase
MLVLRSLLFNVAFYAHLILCLVLYLPLLVLPRAWALEAVRSWARVSLWLLRVIAGTSVEFRGRENIPQGGYLVASKHQSAWETFALLLLFPNPAFVLKRELALIPLFGWLAMKAGMISVDRKGGAAAFAAMAERAGVEIARGRQIIIFPEGTRRPPGAPPDYKLGVVQLYHRLGVPCLPVALNSGLYWPRRRFIRRPGTILVEFLPVIPAGLPRGKFRTLLTERIEEASDRLLAEGRAADGTPDRREAVGTA